MVHYAKFSTRYAALGETFGYDFAVRKFGAEKIDALLEEFGTYRSGKRKGLNKGFIVWNKCEKGGWCRTGAYDHDAGQASGFVETKGIKWIKIVKEWTEASAIAAGEDVTAVLFWSLRREAFVKKQIAEAKEAIEKANIQIAKLNTPEADEAWERSEAKIDEGDDMSYNVMTYLRECADKDLAEATTILEAYEKES